MAFNTVIITTPQEVARRYGAYCKEGNLYKKNQEKNLLKVCFWFVVLSIQTRMQNM